MPRLESAEDYYDYFTLWRDAKRSKQEIEWINELLARPLELPPKTPKGEFIQEYLQGRVNDARRAVQELEQELQVRQSLHEQSVEQMDYQISRAAIGLEHFKGWAVGYNRGVDEKRIELERTLHDLRKEKRSWRVRFWDDVVKLRGELRERRREYEAVVRRAGLQIG